MAAGTFQILGDDLKLESGGGIEVNAGSTRVKVSTGVERHANGIRLSTPGNGLTGGAGSSLSVAAEDSTISVGASGVKVSKALAAYLQIGGITPSASANSVDVDTAVDAGATSNTVRTTFTGGAGIYVEASGSYGAGPFTFPTPTAITRRGYPGYIPVLQTTSRDPVDDGSSNEVYGVPFYNTADSKFYVKFFSDVSGVQTAYSFGGSPPSLDLLLAEIHTFATLPPQALLRSGGAFIDYISSAAGDITGVTAGDGISGGGSSGGVTVAVSLASDPGLEFSSGAVRVKANAAAGLSRGAGGIGVSLTANGSGTGGLEFDGSGNVQIDVAADQGLSLAANGLSTVLDTGASGQLSKGASGIRVATGGVGMPVKFEKEVFNQAGFAYSSPLSTYTVSATPSTHANVLKSFRLLRSGVETFQQVTETPAAAGEWRISGTTLQVYGDQTSPNATWTVCYTSNV